MKKQKILPSTLDAQNKLERKFESFKDTELTYEFCSKKKIGEPYLEEACWVNKTSHKIYYYFLESFVTPGGYLSSSDYEYAYKEFNNLKEFSDYLSQEKLEDNSLEATYKKIALLTKNSLEDTLEIKEPSTIKKLKI